MKIRARLLPDVKTAAARGRGWGGYLRRYGHLPIEHSSPLPGTDMSPRRRLCQRAFDDALFDAYLEEPN